MSAKVDLDDLEFWYTHDEDEGAEPVKAKEVVINSEARTVHFLHQDPTQDFWADFDDDKMIIEIP